MNPSTCERARLFSILIFTAATVFSPPSRAVELSCGLYMKPGTIGFSSNLNRIERNGSMHGVAGAYLVNFDHAATTGALNAPLSTLIASQVSAAFPIGYLQPHSVTEIYVVHSLEEVDGFAASISGKISRRRGSNVIVDFDSREDFHRVYVLDSAVDAKKGLKEPLARNLFEPRAGEMKDVPPLKRRKLGPIVNGARRGGSVHVGGLISISAEPPEGFFAAATAAELEKSGWKVAPAADADVWLYRVPDSREESYFQFGYASPDRPSATPHTGKFKIATGIGPSTHPESVGGIEADLLWLGDEQMGQIDRYLEKISRKDLNLEDLYIERGIVQRVGEKSFVLSGLDHRYALTQAGFDAMETNPELYRRVYDKEYDAFLATLFKDSHPNPNNKSFLLATSRGCSQGCSICCSGGLSQFQYFSAPRMMSELEKIVNYAKIGPDERMNIFFLDSNFNNNPGRIIEFADLYKKSPLYGRFDFFIRHNTVNGFLKPAGGAKIANEELIDAYATLGIKEVFMGIDSYDDASTVTLKTHKFKVAKDGADSRPIYTSGEVTSLINALEKRKLYAKGFFLTNNPWVSDYDRIDSYYNLIDLWLENPRFSIDSARDRNVIRLKPFPGSPIGETSKSMGYSNAKDGMFFTRTPLGQIDEKMEFAGLGRPRQESDTEKTLEEFWTGIRGLKADAEKLARSKDSKQREYGRNILAKFRERDAAFFETLKAVGGDGPHAKRIGQEIRRFAAAHTDLPKWDPEIQKAAFAEAIRSLGDGLKTSLPKKGAALE